VFSLNPAALLAGRSPDQIAKIMAFLIAPGLVLATTVSSTARHGLGIGLEQPGAITELRTEIHEDGSTTVRRGIVIIMEPVESEYRLRLSPGAARAWTSLDVDASRANGQRLHLSGGGFTSRTPLLGVDRPVAVIFEGELARDIQLPGGTQRLEDWQLASKRSLSLVTSVLLACVFAFGMSLPSVLPLIRGHEHDAGEI
jgi:hypothetical protein